MSFKKADTTVSAAVAQNGTFTVSYPAGTNSGTYFGSITHQMWVAGHQKLYTSPAGFTLAFGASNITVTYKGTTPIPANTRVSLQLDLLGSDTKVVDFHPGSALRSIGFATMMVNLGAPVAGASNSIATSQALLAATAAGATLNGTTAGVLDVPRNVVAAWTGTAVLTVTGIDEYGNTVVESSASGTSFTGKKAFAKVTKVVVSADVTGLTVGTGNVLGLPFALRGTGYVIKEFQDGAAPTAGTVVAAVTSTATATTGDVRGTYTPDATPDASKNFQLLVLSDKPSDLGVSQFAG